MGIDKPLQGITPSPGVAGIQPYSVPRHGAPMDLKLDSNEGQPPSAELLRSIAEAGTDVMRRYPDASGVQRRLAERFAVRMENVIVTCGGDDALDRLCRSVLFPGKELLTTDPSFEMLPRYARIMGATVTELDWYAGAFPTDEIIAHVKPETAIVAVVSPNNPSGAVATEEDLRRLSAAAPNAILLVDHAYVEFSDADLTALAFTLPNTIVMRTLSKAWGCAGLRVGYAIGPAELIRWMRAAGGPYAVARPSVALATARLDQGDAEMKAFVAQVRADRAAISEALAEHGQKTGDSQGNFVFVELDDALWFRDAMAGFGIAIRAYPGHPRLGNAVRITSPGDEKDCARVVHAIHTLYAPEAVIFTGDSTVSDIAGVEVVPMGEVSVDALRASAAKLGVTRAWVVAHSAADVGAAREAGMLPIGIADESLIAAGAARVLEDVNSLKELLP